jgi:hypothetical protein
VSDQRVVSKRSHTAIVLALFLADLDLYNRESSLFYTGALMISAALLFIELIEWCAGE